MEDTQNRLEEDYKLLSFREVRISISKLKGEAMKMKKIENRLRLWDCMVSFAEYRYGERVVGKSYRERNDRIKESNYIIEVG